MTDTLPEITQEDRDRYRHFSIELDCPPGMTRPKDLIEFVLAGSGLDVKDFETGNPFFGHQVWILKKSAKKDELYTTVRLRRLKRRVVALYNQGAIRYGTW